MEGETSDERQMKKTGDNEMCSQHLSGFHKNSDEPGTQCGAEPLGNGDTHPLLEVRHEANTPNLANQSNDELLRQLMGEQESGSVDINQMAAEGIAWWNRRMDEMNQEELRLFHATLGILRERVQSHLQQRIRIRDSNSGEMSTSASSTSTNGRGRRRRRR
ncbi:hypothetical protein SLA2020_106700 [Shorea laevis]